jgi:hypothetical protein
MPRLSFRFVQAGCGVSWADERGTKAAGLRFVLGPGGGAAGVAVPLIATELEMTSGSWTWLLILLFVVILGAAIRYGVMMTRRRRLDRSAEANRDEATRELYDKRARPQTPPD